VPRQYIVLKRGSLELCRLAVPQRPYKNFEEFRRTQCHHRKLLIEDPAFYPCLYCGSDGWVYHPDSSSCPVEGNRMRDRITCQVCRGSGRGEKLPLQNVYKMAIQKWDDEKARFEEMFSKAKCALLDLPTEELIALMQVLGKFERGYCTKEEKEKVIQV
jgi:hypothetical protein